MRATLLTISLLTLTAQWAAAVEPELVTVPVEATVKVEGDNYYQARQRALIEAIRSAVRMAVAGVVPPEELERNSELIDERLLKRGMDFVSSYKFLDETEDNAAGTITSRLQVTLFLDSIRGVLSGGGVLAKRRDLPRLVIIIKEQNVGFAAEANFLMLTSITEQILVRNFRQRGFAVADRTGARRKGVERDVRAALEGDSRAAAVVGRELDADMLLFGNTNVDVWTVDEGESVQVTITLTLRGMPDGERLFEQTEVGEGVYDDVLSGSLETIRSTAQIIAREMVMTVRGEWKGLKAKRNG